MIVSFGDKHFHISKFPPIAGRELMVKGEGVRKLVADKNYLPVLSYVKVRLTEDRWIPLSTDAMVSNHVPEGKAEELFMLALAYNCFDIRSLLEAPTIGEVVKEFIHEIIEDAVEGATNNAT